LTGQIDESTKKVIKFRDDFGGHVSIFSSQIRKKTIQVIHLLI
jgi:hypothetical protein